MTETIGLIAGAGRAPMLVADGILSAGRRLAVVGLKGFASPHLAGLADAFTWGGVLRMGGWIRFLRAQGASQAVMIGSVRKGDMYLPFRILRYMPDWRAFRIWYGRLRKDKRDEAALLAAADELASEGIELISSVEYCMDQLADEGVMTKTQPMRDALLDIEFGWPIVRECARLDIGQALAVKERDIIAVEAMEGTDAMIHRAGQLCKNGGWSLMKVARPRQDMRFDVPTIGPDTLKNLAENRCACVVVEAGKTLITDKQTTLALADKLKIA
ncbi:MAG: UDP-2,3-diacylglucosamine diphosphatase LpxI, partial [Phycisphaerae bacterium]|nr:UDP-2,3-diacylglucosamine diphosphatase LpxI [Phycisphaerae bacterium]